jgi:3-hydroxyacyl-CoA dehydrogenase/enoyl-CoA hydratase/3-hydroxybutyryl-CoA epimerase
MLIMLNEAARCLEEKIVEKASYLDLALIMGTGFPPFRGGILRYADERGIENVVNTLNRLAEKYGERFKPSQLLLSMTKDHHSFYS